MDCAAPRHDGEPVSAEPAARLCKPCRLGLGRDLRHIPALDRELEHLLDPRKGASIIRGGGGGLPYNEPAAECRSQIRHDLMVWVQWISEEREPDNCPVRSTAAMAGWIAGQLRWCTFRSWAGDLAAAMAADRGRAMALLDPMPRAEIPIPPDFNWCPVCGETGALYATIYQSPGDRRPSMVTCGACLHEWDTVQWMRLGRIILTWARTRRSTAALPWPPCTSRWPTSPASTASTRRPPAGGLARTHGAAPPSGQSGTAPRTPRRRSTSAMATGSPAASRATPGRQLLEA